MYTVSETSLLLSLYCHSLQFLPSSAIVHSASSCLVRPLWSSLTEMLWTCRAGVTQPLWLYPFRLGWTQVHPNYWISCRHWGWVTFSFFFSLAYFKATNKKNLFGCPSISKPNYLSDLASTYLHPTKNPKPRCHSNLALVVFWRRGPLL
jgi:hypothetical protein